MRLFSPQPINGSVHPITGVVSNPNALHPVAIGNPPQAINSNYTPLNGFFTAKPITSKIKSTFKTLVGG